MVGGRFGSQYKDSSQSITNLEYLEAVKKKIPIFALVEKQVYSEYRVYEHNKKKGVDLVNFYFPSVDSTHVFEFIEAVSSNAVNNAIEPFSEYFELEQYLKQQWGGMMFNFLTKQSESALIVSNLDSLRIMNEKIEFLSKQILTSVGTAPAKLTSLMYELMLDSNAVRDLASAGIKLTPKDILQNDNFYDIIKGKIEISDSKGFSISKGSAKLGLSAEFSKSVYDEDSGDYENLRSKLKAMVFEAGMKISDIT